MLLQVVRLTQTAIVPSYAYPSDSGMDLFYDGTARVAIEDCRSACFDTGIAIKIPLGYEAQIRPKSGLSVKGLMAALGTIDQGYTGALKVVLYNFTGKIAYVQPYQKIAQLVVAPVVHPEIQVVEYLELGDRASNGFGSTGLFLG